MVLPGYKHTVLTSISKELEENMIVCNAPSKTFNIPGIHASNIIIANAKLRSAYQQVLRGSGLSLPNVCAVAAAEAAYTYGEPWLDQLLTYIEGNYRLVASFMAERIPK